jgi:hypothetical protein
MSSDEEGWNELTKRLQHLAYLIQRVELAPEEALEDIFSSCLKPIAGYVLTASYQSFFRTSVKSQLEQLAIEIHKVGKEGKALQRFITSKAGSNSIASHHEVLDRRISELTVSVFVHPLRYLSSLLSTVQVVHGYSFNGAWAPGRAQANQQKPRRSNSILALKLELIYEQLMKGQGDLPVLAIEMRDNRISL